MDRLPLPDLGLDAHELLAHLERLRLQDIPIRSGRAFGYAFETGREVGELAKQAYLSFLSENGLDPTAFPSLRDLENDVIQWALHHTHAPAHAAGTFTSGGTESIILAVKAAREWATQRRGLTGTLDMVLPITAHAAFHKAAKYLGLRPVMVAVHPTPFTADPQAIAQAITPQTALVVASAPSFAHGVVDPVEAVSQLCVEKDLWLHVDGCVGGWLLPYFRAEGAEVPPFDFAVEGVQSMSVDFHKYAFAPKGASAVLFRSGERRAAAAFTCASWTGYGMVNMGVQSSKSGGPLAATWTTLRSLGQDGYRELVRGLKRSADTLKEGIRAIPELRLLGNPAMSVFSFSSDSVNVFHLQDEMRLRGWHLRCQFARGPAPAALHTLLTPVNQKWVEAFLSDLQASVQAAKVLPPSELAAQVTELLQALQGAEISDEMIDQMMTQMNDSPKNMPARTAALNEVMNVLPPPLLERVMLRYMGALLTP